MQLHLKRWLLCPGGSSLLHSLTHPDRVACWKAALAPHHGILQGLLRGR